MKLYNVGVTLKHGGEFKMLPYTRRITTFEIAFDK